MTKQHLQMLDAMRGMAAVSVLLFHLGSWLGAPWLATNAGLSVDLFFCLSGYVLPLAYWSRRDELSDAAFLHIRAVRLMPLIALGALISLSYVLLKVQVLHLTVPPGVIAIAAIGSLLNIPTWNAPAEIGGPMVFPLNGPQYSLFWELVANLLWWSMRKNDRGYLLPAFFLIGATLMLLFGLGGDTEQNFLLGLPRVACSFALGLGCYYLREHYQPSPALNRVVLIVAGVLSLTLLYWPRSLTLAEQMIWIIAVSPALVLAGTRTPLRGWWAKFALLLGALSYPIYALHYPIFSWVNGMYRSRFGAQNFVMEAPLTFVAVIIGAWLALRFFDEPVRRLLTRKFAPAL